MEGASARVPVGDEDLGRLCTYDEVPVDLYDEQGRGSVC